ncbi:MAG: LCP family protein [Candidatus Sericytochromatia bacterium]|nr:LCP family protein [Candidatus Sericytochromatia bacterium]
MNDPYAPREQPPARPDELNELRGIGPSRLRERRRRRPNYALRRLMAMAVLLGLLIGAAIAVGNVMRHGTAPVTIAPACDPVDRINVLVVGIDPKPFPVAEGAKESKRLADTLMLFSLDPRAQRGFVLSIPRETKATLGSAGEGVLGDALAVGGLSLVRNTIEDLTGLTIQHHLALELEGAKTILNELGNCELYLNRPVRVEEPSLGLRLNRETGWQLLRPEDTLAFAFQRTEDEIDRLERQQMLVRMWQNTLRESWNNLWLNRVVSRAGAVMETNLNRPEFEKLVLKWRKIEGRNLTFALLPGEANDRGEWVLVPKRWEALLPRLQNTPTLKSPEELRATVEVLYEEGPEEKVVMLANTLQEQGFQVVRHAKAPQAIDETAVIDRLPGSQRSAALLDALLDAIGPARVELSADAASAYGAHMTVRLGRRFFR